MKSIALIPVSVLSTILPTLHAAKNTTPKLEQPRAVQKAKTPQTSFNAFRDDSFLFSEFRNPAFKEKPADNRADRFPEAYNPWKEDAARTKAAFSY